VDRCAEAPRGAVDSWRDNTRRVRPPTSCISTTADDRAPRDELSARAPGSQGRTAGESGRSKHHCNGQIFRQALPLEAVALTYGRVYASDEATDKPWWFWLSRTFGAPV